MSKLNKNEFRKGVLIGHEKDEPDIPVFIDSNKRKTPNALIIGKVGTGKGFYIKQTGK